MKQLIDMDGMTVKLSQAFLCISELTVKHGNHCLSQCQNQAQGRAKQENVGHFKVKLPQGASVQHGAAARPA